MKEAELKNLIEKAKVRELEEGLFEVDLSNTELKRTVSIHAKDTYEARLKALEALLNSKV